jgi:acetyl esterase
VKTAFHLYPGATHSFIEAMSIAPVAERAIEDGARWLRETLRVAATATR